jgi:hypothetical protein
MKIKKFIQFLKEDKQNSNVDFKKINDYFEDHEYIMEFFYDLTDEGCQVYIENGIVFNINNYGTYWFDIFFPSTVNIAYNLFIKVNKNNDTELDLLISAINRISDALDLEYSLTVKYSNRLEEEMEIKEELENNSELTIILFEKKNTILKDIQVADFYEWSYDHKDENGNLYVDLKFSDVVDLFVKDNNYKDILIDDDWSWTDNYWSYSSDYQSSIDSLFNYYINAENSIKIIKKIINSYGGYEKVIKDYEENINNEEELINYYYKNPSKLENIDSEELLDEISKLESDYHVNAHINQNYDDTLDNFYENLGKVLDYKVIKIEKEEEVLRIKFNYKWYCDEGYDDSDLRKFDSIEHILNEYAYNNRFVLNPYLKDYGDFDLKNFNIEIANMVK